MSRSPIAAAVLALALSGGVAFAQTTTTPPASADQIGPAGVTAPQDFATKAGGAGMFEIQSSQLALQKSQNDDIKAFAQKMVDDHTKAADELKTAAQTDGVTVPDEMDANSQENLQKLQGASGADFDSLYVQLQTQAHIDAVALFAGYSASGQAGALKDFATKTLPTLKDHYNMAIKLPK
jgi:putative membrane protein